MSIELPTGQDTVEFPTGRVSPRICLNCGLPETTHHLATYADGGRFVLICPTATFTAERDHRTKNDDTHRAIIAAQQARQESHRSAP